MGGYGTEFENARERVSSLDVGGREYDFTQILVNLMAGGRTKTIYFAPWSTRPRDPNDARWRQPPGYQIGKEMGGRRLLPEFVFPDGHVRRTLVVPSHITLLFAPGAYLELGDDLALVIQGGLRAGPTQIFLLPDVLGLRTTPWRSPATFPPESAIVRLETTEIERVHPEWFGVWHEESPTSLNASANTRALQACIHAACRDRVRDGISLPPLTVMCQGVYSINETMTALPTTNGHGALWLDGIGDASTRGHGMPTINRYPIGELAAWRFDPSDPSQRALRAHAPEEESSALLRVHPRVSLEISGVGLTCHAWNNGVERAQRVDVAHCILVEGRRGAATALAVRHVFIDRCGISGGSEAIIGVFERSDADSVVRPTGGATSQTLAGIPKWGEGHSPPNSSQLFRPGSRYLVQGCSFDAVLSPLNVTRGIPARSSKAVVRAFLNDASMLDVIGGKVHQSIGALLGARSGVIDNQAGLHLRGGSTLVRSVTFHLDEGPRPSLPASLADRPDGQDIWLDAGILGRIGYHLTVLHADSQSWWFLGGTRSADGTASVVSLLNVGANDVNLASARAAAAGSDAVSELNRPYGESRISTDSAQLRRLFLPPAVMWPGGRVPLLLLGCFFDRYCTAPDRGEGLTVNVGTVFRQGLNLTLSSWMTPDAIPRPDQPHSDLSALAAPAISGRAIPSQWLGLTRYTLYPAELQGRSTLGEG